MRELFRRGVVEGLERSTTGPLSNLEDCEGGNHFLLVNCRVVVGTIFCLQSLLMITNTTEHGNEAFSCIQLIHRTIELEVYLLPRDTRTTALFCSCRILSSPSLFLHYSTTLHIPLAERYHQQCSSRFNCSCCQMRYAIGATRYLQSCTTRVCQGTSETSVEFYPLVIILALLCHFPPVESAYPKRAGLSLHRIIRQETREMTAIPSLASFRARALLDGFSCTS